MNELGSVSVGGFYQFFCTSMMYMYACWYVLLNKNVTLVTTVI